MAADPAHQAYIKSLEQNYSRPQLVRSLMPSLNAGALTVTVGLAAGQSSPVTAGPINFTVTFSRPVTGFDNTDISFVGSSVGGTLAAAVTGTGPAYNVAVTGMTGNGLVAVSVVPSAATDATGNPTPGSIAAYVRLSSDVTPPTVVLSKAAGQADPANAGPINFAAVFNEAVMGLLPAGLDYVTGTTAPGTYTATITGSGTTYNIAMSGMSGAGNVSLQVKAAGTTDFMGNPNTASNTVVVAYAPPTPFPDASNTGPAAGTVFTVTSGDFQTTSNGQIIENRQINGGVIDIRHINVTVRNCIVTSTDFVALRTTGAGPFTGCLIERSRFIGTGASTRLNAIQPDAMTAVEIRFCDISGFENGIAIGANGMNIHDNYIHDLNTGGGTPHVDGIQGGGGFTSLTINHNTIMSYDTSCIILQNEGGAFSGAVISNNRLIIDPTLGGSYCLLCQKRDDSPGLVSNITVTNNRMSKGPTPGASYGFFHNVTALTWTGNVDDTTGATINPDIG